MTVEMLAGGLLDKPLKLTKKTVSRPWRLHTLLPPLEKGDGGGFENAELNAIDRKSPLAHLFQRGEVLQFQS